ncbi:MAG: FAD:protein FMN transferase, partial [Ilumatobacteraceae bacterium]
RTGTHDRSGTGTHDRSDDHRRTGARGDRRAATTDEPTDDGAARVQRRELSVIDVRSTGRRSYAAMGSTARAVVVAEDAEALLDHVGRRLDELEQRWSRFVDHSEITGLNRAGGAPRRCSRDTVVLIQSMLRAWRTTRGAFDPTMLGALVEAGYVSSRTDPGLSTSIAPDVRWLGRPGDVDVDETSGVVTLPLGTSLDPGGLGKGLAADLVVDDLMSRGAHGTLIEVGGDLRVSGTPPSGSTWTVSIAPTPSDEPVLVHLESGAVATSTTELRRWWTPTGERHHLIDPVGLTSTTTTVIACTVIAGTGAWAETFTKVPFVRGVDEALAMFEEHRLAARIVDMNRSVFLTSAWKEFAC